MTAFTITVDGKTQKATIFAVQAQGAYTKALVFAAEARVAISERNNLWAAIAGYYSLFHLSIALMFMAPHLVAHSLLGKLVRNRDDGLADPTGSILHRHLPEFLKGCEAAGLPPRLRGQLAAAKRIREDYVNYGPRSVWRHGKPTFLTHGMRPSDARRVVLSIPPLLRRSLRWAHAQHDDSYIIVVAVTAAIPWFLRNSDLHYSRWCSPKVLAEAEALLGTLPYVPVD